MSESALDGITSVLNAASNAVSDESVGLTIHFYPEKSYPILQVYTPPHRRSIAIENLSAAPDAFNNDIGLIHLQAGESYDFRTMIRVDSF